MVSCKYEFCVIFQVKDVRLITDNKTRRSKGIAYVEFKDTESVPLAMGLTNQKLLGVPIIVQASQAEKNRLSMPTSIVTKGIMTGPMRLYVGSLHFNITEEMLKGIFEPFGKVIYNSEGWVIESTCNSKIIFLISQWKHTL